MTSIIHAGKKHSNIKSSQEAATHIHTHNMAAMQTGTANR